MGVERSNNMQAAMMRSGRAMSGRWTMKLTVTRAMSSKIIYTHTDEAPALATYAFLPIIRKFTDPAGISVELADISVAGRILACFEERLTPEQRIPDELSRLGEMCKAGTANITKLPNVS